MKIGLIGSESSHSLAFAKLANIPEKNGSFSFENIKVTHVYGLDHEQACQLADECKIAQVVNDPKEMVGNVDAVMILFRDGNLHYEYAKYFCNLNVPVWVDKPFTISTSQARELCTLAKEKNTILAGGSTCKYCTQVLEMKDIFTANKKDIVSAYLNFPGMPDSPYNGVHFYMPHTAEILFTVFGNKIKSVKTDFTNNTQMAVFAYENFSVIVNFCMSNEYQMTLYTQDKLYTSQLDISTIYKQGFAKFIEAVQTNTIIEPYNSLLQPVVLVNAIEQSMQSGETVLLKSEDFI